MSGIPPEKDPSTAEPIGPVKIKIDSIEPEAGPQTGKNFNIII